MFVAYYRVSTQKQGQSGLGLEAQRNAVAHYNPIAEFVEVESGKQDDRTELNAALDYCRTNKATLVIAKLDRLSRNAHYILGLMERGVRIRCADMPDADEFQLHLYAILAQKERKMISERTKAALKAAKERGVKLGGKQASTVERMQTTDRVALTHIEEARSAGYHSYNAIANALNERAVRTSTGKLWSAMTVKRIVERNPSN